MLSLPAPSNWVQKNGAKRRSRRSRNWLCSGNPPPWSDARSLVRLLMSYVPLVMLGKILLHGCQRGAHHTDVGPEIDFPAGLFGFEHPCFAEHAQVMRDRRARERRGGDDLADVEPSAAIEHEQDALPVRIAQRDEDAGDSAPGCGDGARAGPLHGPTLFIVMS